MITLIEDTRQQAGKYKKMHEYFDDRGIKVLRSKLPVGDYALLTDLSTVVDTKKGFQECVANFASKDHERVKREIEKAEENGIKLIFLVIDEKAKCIEDAIKWKNQFGKVKGVTLYKILNSVQMNHDVRFEFCTTKESGRKVLELLGVDDDESKTKSGFD